MRRLVYRFHAVQKMALRAIATAEVEEVIRRGEVIREYPEDRPYPSRLILGRPGGRVLHVVAAASTDADEEIIITVYEPDPRQWDSKFRVRRSP